MVPKLLAGRLVQKSFGSIVAIGAREAEVCSVVGPEQRQYMQAQQRRQVVTARVLRRQPAQLLELGCRRNRMVKRGTEDIGFHAGVSLVGGRLVEVAQWRERRVGQLQVQLFICLLYTSPSPRDLSTSRMPSSA